MKKPPCFHGMYIAYLRDMNKTMLRLNIVLVLLFVLTPATALENLIQGARNNSIDAYILELEREQSETQRSQIDYVRSPSFYIQNVSNIGTIWVPESYTITNGNNVTVNPPYTRFSFSAAPRFIYNLQGDQRTEITLGLDEFVYRFPTNDYSKLSWNVTPFIRVTQPLTHFFEDSSAMEDIDYTLSYLSSELSYRRGMIDIDRKVLETVREVLVIDKQVAESTYQLDRLVEDHERNISLGTYSRSSARSREVLEQIDSLERNLRSLRMEREFVIDEVERITGMRIEQVPDIPAPRPLLEPSRLGNTSVLIQRIAIDRAEEDLAEYLKDSWNMDIYAGYGAGFEKDQAKPGHEIQAGVEGAWKDLNLSLGMTANFGTRTTLRGVVEGSWGIDGNKGQRDLTRRDMEYDIRIAQSRYDQAEAAYRRTNMQLELNLENWERSRDQLELRIEYARLDLEEARSALERGIGRQRSVEDARHRLDQLEYDRLLKRIEGWILQRTIESHVM